MNDGHPEGWRRETSEGTASGVGHVGYRVSSEGRGTHGTDTVELGPWRERVEAL